MFLALDIGNTNIVAGVFRGRTLLDIWRVSTQQHRTADEYGILLGDLFKARRIRPGEVCGLALSSVVPPLTSVFLEVGQRYFSLSPLVITHLLKTGLTLKVENPKEVGADRIVNAAAGYHLWGGPLIIVDFGTATTFCTITQEGDYLGGAIAPGLMISAEALSSRAAKLPRVELSAPPSVIGRDTISAMQSGLIYGYAGLVDEIVRRIKEEIGKALVVATGGLSSVIVPACRTIEKTHPTLTLEGLRVIYNLNCGGAEGKKRLKN